MARSSTQGRGCGGDVGEFREGRQAKPSAQRANTQLAISDIKTTIGSLALAEKICNFVVSKSLCNFLIDDKINSNVLDDQNEKS